MRNGRGWNNKTERLLRIYFFVSICGAVTLNVWGCCAAEWLGRTSKEENKLALKTWKRCREKIGSVKKWENKTQDLPFIKVYIRCDNNDIMKTAQAVSHYPYCWCKINEMLFFKFVISPLFYCNYCFIKLSTV